MTLRSRLVHDHRNARYEHGASDHQLNNQNDRHVGCVHDHNQVHAHDHHRFR